MILSHHLSLDGVSHPPLLSPSRALPLIVSFMLSLMVSLALPSPSKIYYSRTKGASSDLVFAYTTTGLQLGGVRNVPDAWGTGHYIAVYNATFTLQGK